MVTDKQLLVQRLVQRMDLDRIFLFSYSFLGKEHQHLILVMNPMEGVSPKVMKPVVELCLIDIPEVSFELIPFGEWQHKVRQGSLFYAYASLPQHLVYTSKRKKSRGLSVAEIGGVIELAEQVYTKMSEAGKEFREGAKTFAAVGDYVKATFMVHQSLESFLRLQQNMIQGKVNQVHHLESRMRVLSNHFPAFRTILLSDAFIAMETFKLLDQCFHAVKQNKDMEISAVDASYLYDKSCEISNAIEVLYQFFLGALKAEKQRRAEQVVQPAEADKAKKTTVSARGIQQPVNQIQVEDFSGFPWTKAYKEDVNKLLDKIKAKHNPEQITMLNYHTGGFSGRNIFQSETAEAHAVKVELYLVVLMKNTGPFSFKTMQVGVASAMIVFMDTAYVERKLREGGRFVHTVWTKGHVLRKKSTFEPVFEVGEVDWKAEVEIGKMVWENAKVCINNLYQIVQDYTVLTLDSALLMLRNLYEIGVNTYTYCALGYRLNNCTLDEQIDWTGVIGRKVVDYLYPDSEAELARAQLILDPKIIWWNNIKIGLSQTSKPGYREMAREVTRFFEKEIENILLEMTKKISKEGVVA